MANVFWYSELILSYFANFLGLDIFYDIFNLPAGLSYVSCYRAATAWSLHCLLT